MKKRQTTVIEPLVSIYMYSKINIESKIAVKY